MGHVVDGRMWVFAYTDPTSKRDRKGPIADRGRQSWPYTKLDPKEIDAEIARIKKSKFANDPNPYQDPDGPWYVIAYDGLNDLIFALRILLRDETWATGTGAGAVIHHNPCLCTLEIWSHGNPDRCGGITAHTVVAFAAELDKLMSCDNLDIYLSGCNTGCRNWTPGPINQESNQENVAELLADQLPGAAHPNKSYRVTVYGTKGYHSNTHASGNSQTSQDYSSGSPPTYHGPYSRSANADQTPVSDPTFYDFKGPNSA
jgi:hypothetical protein